MIYNNIGATFIELLKLHITSLKNFYPTDDEKKLIKDIEKLIKSRGIDL